MKKYFLELNAKLNKNPKHKGLYNWCINVIHKETKEKGRDLIPFDGINEFKSTDISYKISLEKYTGKSKKFFFQSEWISVQLIPDHEERYTMLGAARDIKDIELSILEKDKLIKGKDMQVKGYHAFSDDGPDAFHGDESLSFVIYLEKHDYENIISLAKNKLINEVYLSVTDVKGFYSDWSPTVSRPLKMVLTDKEHSKELGLEDDKLIYYLNKEEVTNFRLTFSVKNQKKISIDSIQENKHDLDTEHTNTQDEIKTEKKVDIYNLIKQGKTLLGWVLFFLILIFLMQLF